MMYGGGPHCTLCSMTGSGLHILVVCAFTIAVGVVMSRVGIGTGLLRQRSEPRRCPSCGRLRGPHGCESCGR
jgi:hypothetical protein